MESNKQSLQRTLGLVTAITLVISSMIGSGIFKKIAPMSAELMSPEWVIGAWLLAGVISLTGALTNAEVAGMIADPGGQYAFFKPMYGRIFAYFFGWTNFAVIQTATMASVAYVFSQSVNTVLPLPRLPGVIEAISLGGVIQPFENSGVKLLTVLLIILLTAYNIRGVKYSGLFSDVMASVVLASLGLFIVLAFFFSSGSVSNLVQDAPTPVANDFMGMLPHLFTAMMSAFWAYEGWNNLGFLGGEIKNPNRNIPLALMTGVGTVMFVYTMVNVAYLYVLPVDQLAAINQQENGIAAITVMEHMVGPIGAMAITSLILLATLGATNGVIVTAARCWYAMANDRLFWRQAATAHPRFQTPAFALTLQAVWACMLVFSGSFDQLTDMLIFAAFLFYGAMALGVFILRHKMPDAPRPYKALGYPVLPALFILFSVVLVVNNIIEKPREAMMGLALIATGAPLYWFWNKGKTSQ